MSPTLKRYQQHRDTAALLAWLVGGLVIGASIAVLLLSLYSRAVS